MQIEYYTITVVKENGEVFETRRHTKEGMKECYNQYLVTPDVAKVSVLEHVDLERI